MEFSREEILVQITTAMRHPIKEMLHSRIYSEGLHREEGRKQ